MHGYLQRGVGENAAVEQAWAPIARNSYFTGIDRI